MEVEENLKLIDPQLNKFRQKIDPLCLDCQEDSYDLKLKEYLLFKLGRSFSPRVLSIQNPKIAQKEEHSIAYCAKKFRVYRCHANTLHLQRFGKKVPMMKQAKRFATQVHGKNHRDSQAMMMLLEAKYPNLILYYIRDFIQEFSFFCPQCRITFNHPIQNKIFPTSQIWRHLLITDQKKNYENRKNEKQRSQRDNYLGCIDCLSGQSICENDQYQSGYFICQFIRLEEKFPLTKYSQEAGQLSQGIKIMIKQMEIRRCQKGTPHLWYANPKVNQHMRGVIYTNGQKGDINNKKVWQRVLMKRQSDALANILHHWSQTKKPLKWEKLEEYHMNYITMRKLLNKFPEIYPYNILASTKNILARCRTCNSSRKFKQLERPKIIFDDKEMRQFKSKQERKKKQYLQTIQNKQNKKSIRNATKKLEGIDQSAIDIIQAPSALYQQTEMSHGPKLDPTQEYIQGFTEPQNQSHLPQVQAMLKEYKNYPEILSFLNNDLIWNEESGPPPDLYQFEEQLGFQEDENQIMFIKKYGYDRMRRVIVIITNKMKTMYNQFGDSVCIDYIPSLIKRRSPAGWHFTIGFFSGQDSNLQNLIFGLCFLSEDLMIYHKKSLQYFFEGMSHRMPETLITSNEKAICQAVDLIQSENPQYKFKHNINWFYVVEHLKSLLAGQLDQEQMLQLYCKSILENNPLVYQQLVQVMTSRMVQKPILEEFTKSSKKYCFSCLQPFYAGFTLSTSRVLKIYELIQKTFIYQGRVARFFYYAFQLQRRLALKSLQPKIHSNINLLLQNQKLLAKNQNKMDEQENTNKQEFTQFFEEISCIASVLQEQPYKILLETYNKAHKMLQIQQKNKSQSKQQEQKQSKDDSNIKKSTNIVNILQFRSDIEVKFRYPVVFSVQNDHWQCPCNLIYISGLPCHHLLKVIKIYGGSILYYISSRWLIDFQDNSIIQTID